MSNHQSGQSSSPNSNQPTSNHNSANDGKSKRSAPEHPPATDPSQRTKAAYFEESSSDRNRAEF